MAGKCPCKWWERSRIQSTGEGDSGKKDERSVFLVLEGKEEWIIGGAGKIVSIVGGRWRMAFSCCLFPLWSWRVGCLLRMSQRWWDRRTHPSGFNLEFPLSSSVFGLQLFSGWLGKKTLLINETTSFLCAMVCMGPQDVRVLQRGCCCGRILTAAASIWMVPPQTGSLLEWETNCSMGLAPLCVFKMKATVTVWESILWHFLGRIPH